MGTQYVVKVDNKRRPTLPAQLLADADLPERPDSLIAHADGAGRIVLETPEAIKRRIRQRATAGRQRTGRGDSAAESLLADRAADPSAHA